MIKIDEFIESLRQAKLSPATIEAYRRELRLFQAYAKSNHLRITQIRSSVILQYLKEMDQLHPSQGEAVRRRMSVLSSYFKYLEATTDGRIKNPVVPLRRPRRQKPRPKPVEDEVLERLLLGVTNERDRAIIMVLASSGARLAELVSLDRGSFQVEVVQNGGSVQVTGVGRVIGKRNKEREILVDIPTLELLHLYQQSRGNDGIDALFISNRGRRMSERAVQHMLWKWCDKLKLPRIHPHALRHTASSTWHRLGMDTYRISKLLGHESVATTELYIQPDLARLRAEYFASMESLAQRVAPKPSSHQ